MRCRNAFMIAAAVAAAAPAAHAMSVDPHGTGQVLVFPYYTANGGNDTLIAIANTTGHAKAVKVRFHEGYDGRGVLDLDVYIAPHAEWAASVTSGGDATAVARLLTSSEACTVPALTGLPSGARSIDFSAAAFAGDDTYTGPTGNSDGGPTTPDRTREGHFDVFEMGEVTGNAHGSLDAITASNCGALVSAWSPSGYWTADGNADLSPPAGGLYGTEYVVDVARGTLFSADAVAIDGFRDAPLHTAPGAASPDLDSASAGADGRYAALVIANGKPLQLEYANAIDATSALFMTDMLRGDFIRDPGLGADTDWIVTAPTKRFYVDPAITGAHAAAPFENGFMQSYRGGEMTDTSGNVLRQWGSSYPYACATVGAVAYGRDGAAMPVGVENDGGPVNGGPSPNSSYSLTPCLETSVLTFETRVDALFGEIPESAIGSKLTDATDPTGDSAMLFSAGVDLLPPEGTLGIDLVHGLDGVAVAAHALPAATNGDVLKGLPVVAFAATTFVNGNVSAGVLANYGASAGVHGGVACANTSGGACE
ncbi:MAG TPA: hypothetical protein VFV97_17155 [Rhodanobacteraceae bacterium]|nr:hypothetical protein [Rhodanobacteraceae bacterium]